MAENPISLMDDMFSIIATFISVEVQPRQLRFEVFSEQLPRIVEYYTSSKIMNPEAIQIEFAKRIYAIFMAAISYFPIELENGIIEKNVFYLKVLQDQIPSIIRESRLRINVLGIMYEIETMRCLCDALCVKMFYIYDSDVHPFRSHHQMLENAVPYMRTFLNARYVFFAYSAMGGYSRMPHIYLNLTRYMELAETMFLMNCRYGIYTSRPSLNCQRCKNPINVDVEDFTLIGLCGHLYCLYCADFEPSLRHRLPCISCEMDTEFLIRNSFVFTTWKVSSETRKVFQSLGVPQEWYEVVPEAFYEIKYERKGDNEGDTVSLGYKGYLGSHGCINLAPIIYRDDGSQIETDFDFDQRISSRISEVRSHRLFSIDWIMGPDRPFYEEAPPPQPIDMP